MKVFVPATDEMLRSTRTIQGSLVPFDPKFLKASSDSSKSDRKPANWISNNDYESAKKRLMERPPL
jgi:hypothetical protein